MLRAAAAAAAIFPARFAAAPAVAAAAELRSPLLRVLGTLRGGRSSVLLGRRARFCSNSSDTEAAAAAEAEAKAEDATVAEGGADGNASSAIVPTNPQIEDCLSVRALFVWIRVHLLSCLHQPFAWNCWNLEMWNQ